MRRIVMGWTAAVLFAVMATGAAGADAAKAPDGKPIFVKYKCGACHTIASQGIVKKPAPAAAGTPAAAAKKPPDLSSVGLDHKDGWIAQFLMKKEAVDGRKHMKLFRGTPAELATLSAWLETMKAKKPAK